MQKRKSFLMKLLVLLTVVFCTFAVAFGMVGCAADGKDGKDGKDGVGIQSSAIVDGKLEITYTNGDKDTLDLGTLGGNGLASCTHAKISHNIQEATCCQEGVALRYCLVCDAYDVASVGVDTSDDAIHGKYAWEVDDEGVPTRTLVEDITVHPQTSLEQQYNACPERTCNDCGKDLAAHANMDWVDTVEGTNPCIEEHVKVYACLDCKATITDITTEEPIGHKLVYTSHTAPVNGKSTVTLTCTECSMPVPAEATMVAYDADSEYASVMATCETGGYEYYEYTYMSRGDDEAKASEKVGYFKANEVSKVAEHTFTADGKTLRVALGGHVEYDLGHADALEALFAGEKPVLETIAGLAQVCNNATTVVGDCAVCGHPITFEVTGEHTYDIEKDYVAADCTNDGYVPCSECGLHYTDETKDLAVGHVWEISGDVNTTLNTVSVKCKVCKTGMAGVSVVAGTVHDGVDCKDYTYTPYTTTGLDNGLASTHANYNGNVVLTANVKDETAPLHHVLGKGTAYEITGLILDEEYDYNDNIAAALAAGDLEMIGGLSATCSTYKSAVFDCSVCGNPITINVSGEHTLPAGDPLTYDATCTTYGYTYKVCSEDHDAATDGVQTREIIFDYIDAKEHNYEIVPATEEAFIAGTANTITIKCACGDQQTLSNPAQGAVIPGTSECNPADTTPYTFTYSYDVTNPDGVDTIEVEFVVNKTSSAPSHKIVVEGFDALDDINVNDSFSSNDMWVAALKAEQVRWIAGEAGDCTNYKPAVFDCADCGHPILVKLSGQHQLDGVDIVEPAKCEAVGTTHQTCTVCSTKIEIVAKREAALGHDYEWTVAGASATSEGTCTAVCNNDATHTLTATAAATTEPATCCEDGSVKYTYTYNGQQVGESATFTIAANGAHNFVPEKKAEYVKDGYKYTFIFCQTGEKYVQQSKDPV